MMIFLNRKERIAHSTNYIMHSGFGLLGLLGPREQWPSIVVSMSVCVCVSVCLSVCLCICLSASISGATRAIFSNFSVHVAYGRGSVLLRQGDEIQEEGGSFGGFLPY